MKVNGNSMPALIGGFGNHNNYTIFLYNSVTAAFLA